MYAIFFEYFGSMVIKIILNFLIASWAEKNYILIIWLFRYQIHIQKNKPFTPATAQLKVLWILSWKATFIVQVDENVIILILLNFIVV